MMKQRLQTKLRQLNGRRSHLLAARANRRAQYAPLILSLMDLHGESVVGRIIQSVRERDTDHNNRHDFLAYFNSSIEI